MPDFELHVNRLIYNMYSFVPGLCIIHFVYINSLLLFMVKQYWVEWIYHDFLNLFFFDALSSCFQFVAIKNNAATNIPIQVFL